MTADFVVTDHGTVVQFQPCTELARAEVEAMGLAGWQRLGTGFAVDHRLAGDLACALAANGFALEDGAGA